MLEICANDHDEIVFNLKMSDADVSNSRTFGTNCPICIQLKKQAQEYCKLRGHLLCRWETEYGDALTGNEESLTLTDEGKPKRLTGKGLSIGEPTGFMVRNCTLPRCDYSERKKANEREKFIE